MRARMHARKLYEHICVYGMCRGIMSCYAQAFRKGKCGYETKHGFYSQLKHIRTHTHTHAHNASQCSSCPFPMLSLPWVLGCVLLCSSREEHASDGTKALFFSVFEQTKLIPARSEQPTPDVFVSVLHTLVLLILVTKYWFISNKPTTNLSINLHLGSV